MLLLSKLVFVGCLAGCMCLDSLRFLALGDWGGIAFFPYDTPIEATVGKQMGYIAEAYQTSFNLALGDNFYWDGVQNVEDKRFFETFENVFKAESLSNPWYMIAGNHDHKGNVSAQIAYTQVSKRWMYPDYYYKVNYPVPGGKSIDIIMVDTILLCGNTESDFTFEQPSGPVNKKGAEEQWAWLEKQLASSKADYLLVGGHFPVYSIAEHGPTSCLVERLDPLLYKYNVTAYLCGHDHNLQHLQTSKGDQTMDYFVIGAADYVQDNKKHEGSVPTGSSKYYWAELMELGGFAYFEATAENLVLTFFNGYRKPLYKQAMKPRQWE